MRYATNLLLAIFLLAVAGCGSTADFQGRGGDGSGIGHVKIGMPF